MTPIYIKKTKQCFPDLTKGLKKVADYLLADPIVFAIHPAKRVGTIIGVSETMVIRFCNSIGYKGYSLLQKDIRKHLLDLNHNALADSTKKDHTSNNFTNSLHRDINNIHKAVENVEIEQLETIVNTIINSEKVLIAGYYHSFTFAHWLYFNLNYTMGNASLYRPETDAGLLDLLPKKSCIIVFSFYRYALDTIRLAEEAKNKGIKVITITDSRVAPITEFADIIVPIHMTNNSLFDKGPVTLAVVNSILYEIIQQVKDRGKIHTTFKYFIKDGED